MASQTITFGVTGNENNWLGASGGTENEQVAAKFTPSIGVNSLVVTIKINNFDNPSHNADSVKCAVQADSSGSPSGTDLASTTVSSASIPTYPTTTPNTAFTVTGLNLSAGVTYWLVFSRTGTPTNANAYFIYLDGSTGTGLVKKIPGGGGAWQTWDPHTFYSDVVLTGPDSLAPRLVKPNQAVKRASFF